MKKVLLLLVILILVGCSNSTNMFKKITYVDAQELMKNSEVIIIDVRSSTEYQSNHIDNAINIPLDSISESELKNVISSLDDNIIVYCASGFRSDTAAQILSDFGYTNVYDLGSIDNWSEDDE